MAGLSFGGITMPSRRPQMLVSRTTDVRQLVDHLAACTPTYSEPASPPSPQYALRASDSSRSFPQYLHQAA